MLGILFVVRGIFALAGRASVVRSGIVLRRRRNPVVRGGFERPRGGPARDRGQRDREHEQGECDSAKQGPAQDGS